MKEWKSSPLTKAYGRVFDEIADKGRYRTWTVAGFYKDNEGKADPTKVNVVVRIDVDNGLHFSVPLAHELSRRGIQASHFFLTFPEKYYQIWGSGVPAEVAALGQEVGIHTDHYYAQLTGKGDGLECLRNDIRKLSAEAEVKVRGMVFHGHKDIDALGVRNWDLTKNINPVDLGLEYHDGYQSCYLRPGSETWKPKCDIQITDYLGFSESWGWNYDSSIPMRALRRARPGQIVHLSFHTQNAFEYWKHWTHDYHEAMLSPDTRGSFLKKAALIRIRPYVRKLRSKVVKRRLLNLAINSFSWFLARFVGRFTKRPHQSEWDSSWEAGREMIYGLGLDYWRSQIEKFGIQAPGGCVVEVGPGNGQWLLAFAHDAREVIGVEPNDKVRAYAAEKISEHPDLARKIQLKAASAERIPVSNHYADTVLCAGVLMFTEQDRAIAEMARILKPDGKICITANGLGYPLMWIREGIRHRSYEKVRFGLRGLFSTILKWMGKTPPYPTAFSVSEIKAKFEKEGLELLDSRVYLEMEAYPRDQFGFPTNYCFIGQKKNVVQEAQKIAA